MVQTNEDLHSSPSSPRNARRVVAKVEFRYDELFPRAGFIVTTLEADSRAVARFYNKRGTAEQWIRAGKEAVKLTRLSCHRFRAKSAMVRSDTSDAVAGGS